MLAGCAIWCGRAARGPERSRPGGCSRSSPARSSRSSSARCRSSRRRSSRWPLAVLTGLLPAGRRLRRLRQRHDPAHRRRVPGGERRGEVRPRRARRPPGSSAVFGRSTLGLSYSHLPARRGDRARRFRATPRAPACSIRSRSRWPTRPARRRIEPDRAAARRVPDVLGHRQPQRLVGALADGDGRQPARHRDRARRSASRSGSAVAARRVGADALRDGAAAAAALSRHRAGSDGARRRRRPLRGRRSPRSGR